MIKQLLFLLIISLFFWTCAEDEEPLAEDCAGVAGGDNICGCTDSTATNFDSLATYDDGSCEFLLNGIPIKWIRTYDGDESWCVNTVSDGGFIIAGATNYTGQIIKTDSNGEKEWHQLYDNSTSLYRVRQTADGGFITTGRERTEWAVLLAPVSISQS